MLAFEPLNGERNFPKDGVQYPWSASPENASFFLHEGQTLNVESLWLSDSFILLSIEDKELTLELLTQLVNIHLKLVYGLEIIWNGNGKLYRFHWSGSYGIGLTSKNQLTNETLKHKKHFINLYEIQW